MARTGGSSTGTRAGPGRALPANRHCCGAAAAQSVVARADHSMHSGDDDGDNARSKPLSSLGLYDAAAAQSVVARPDPLCTSPAHDDVDDPVPSVVARAKPLRHLGLCQVQSYNDCCTDNRPRRQPVLALGGRAQKGANLRAREPQRSAGGLAHKARGLKTPCLLHDASGRCPAPSPTPLPARPPCPSAPGR